MENIFEELWREYKKQIPEQRNKVLHSRVVDAEDNLCDTLCGNQEELFEIYDLRRAEEEEHREFLAFKSGASFGVKFIMEALGKK